MILNDRVTNKFSLVSRHMTHGKDMLNTNWAVSIHVTEQNSVFRGLSGCVETAFVLPGEL